MQPILANQSVSISELKRNPTAVIEQAGGEPIVILNHNIPSAYLIPTDLYEKMLDMLDDIKLAKLVKDRMQGFDITQAKTVTLDELMQDDF